MEEARRMAETWNRGQQSLEEVEQGRKWEEAGRQALSERWLNKSGKR